ncbi:MAG: ABC transporter permease subunit [Candidatus Mcinerneyibacterium aminivorans]|uniref:ABC transporter permease subunit n=1 Tax=Candidatus Mcinerneyibacterium aminivorans TaxID=2703815 RepID=A0A5D0M9D0_9BACT|nr:MAG: ABC transporter permease subunit [Candidatus Mcinerneyibacterium aminivorans]
MKKSFINKIIATFIFLLIWHFASKSFSSIILPSPFEVVISFINNINDKNFFKHIGVTVYKAFWGIVISFLLAFPIGVLMGIKKEVYDFFHPFVVFIQSMPVIAWVLLALIWFDNNFIPVFVVIIAVIPIIILNIAEGVKRVDHKLLEMAEIYKLSKGKVIKNIYIPSIAGYFESSLKIVFGNTFKVVVMAEVLAHPGMGIGEKMSWARINIETADLLAWSFMVVIITFIIMGVLKLFQKEKN